LANSRYFVGTSSILTTLPLTLVISPNTPGRVLLATSLISSSSLLFLFTSSTSTSTISTSSSVSTSLFRIFGSSIDLLISEADIVFSISSGSSTSKLASYASALFLTGASASMSSSSPNSDSLRLFF
jgi:hypothetical protein